MQICEAGANKALGKAHKKGYEIVPLSGGRICVFAECWALETSTRCLPLKVSQTLVEHYGELPSDPAFVQKGRANQLMMDHETMDRRDELMAQTKEDRMIHRIPILFRDKWALFATMEGAVFAFDQELLNVLDWDVGSCDMRVSVSGMGIFDGGDWRLTVAPGRFGRDEAGKLAQIAALYKEQRVTLEEMPENLCLFEDMEREE